MNRLDRLEANLAAARRLLPVGRHDDVLGVSPDDLAVQLRRSPMSGATLTPYASEDYPMLWSVEIEGVRFHGCLTPAEAAAAERAAEGGAS